MAEKRYDCIVIGAGHNGLVCAERLARSGRSVLVLEANSQVGGAACTREFAPGYRVSSGAHIAHLLPRALLSELRLEQYGLTWAARELRSAVLRPGEGAVDLEEGLDAPERVRRGDFEARMHRFAKALVPLFGRVPPRLGTDDWADRLALLKLGWAVRRLGRADMRELLRIGGMNVYDLLKDSFESDSLQAALGLDAVLGSNFGPRSPGTVLTLLYRRAGECAAGATPLASSLCQPRGGMGAVTEALAAAARAGGAEIRTSASVARILVENDRAVGVELSAGERIDSRTVISNADPKRTFLDLLGSRHLDTGFVRRVAHIRSRGLAAKLHLALDGLPRFARDSKHGRFLLAPSLDHIERAYNHAKYGEFSTRPVMEITIPTLHDPGLAPAGHHVLSAIVQYAPYDLKGGWQGARQRFCDTALEELSQVAPDLRQHLVAQELLTPQDLESAFGASGGHWHHGDLAFDQLMMVRPVPGAAQHRTPLAGLYLCGAGCHPGGGVMGVAGRNAADELIKGDAP
jgi:phytoene dehydrogenase-like protein